MESKSQFDLNQAISQWRLSLAGSPAFKIENLDELEAHLRDSAVSLQSAELTAEESFSLALGRLGDRAQLENEYGKMNLRQLWLNRCLWIVAGVLLNFFFARFNQFALTVGCEMAVLRGMDSHLASPLYNLVSAMLPFCEFVLFWKFCLQNRNWGRTVSNLITVHPILSGLAVSTFLFGVHFASGHPHEAMDMIYPPSRSHGPSFHVNWYTENFTDRWVFYLQPLLWMTFVPQIAAYTFRLRKGRDHRKIVLFDQVIWMGAGIVLEKFVFIVALYQSWKVLFAGWLHLGPVPLYWHVLSSLLAGVSLFMPLLIIKFVWNFVGNHKNHRSLKWLGSSFATRPGMTAIALILSHLALLQIRGLVFPDVMSHANFREALNILGKWTLWEDLAKSVFLPVLALVILAREYQRSRMASSPGKGHRASSSTGDSKIQPETFPG